MFSADLLTKLQALALDERMPDDFLSTVERFYAPLAAHIAAVHTALSRTAVIGICGPQGSGKSTIAGFLKLLLEESGLKTAVLSIDDLYLTRAEREALALKVHPLLKTRGPPGTHDVAMGMKLFDRLSAAGPAQTTLIPRFDKSVDDRAPQSQWTPFTGRPDIILFEGWCIGARPQPDSELATPVNALEREQDPEGTWRRYVNKRLAGSYQDLFKLIGRLVLLKPPSFAQVQKWRELQEDKLRKKAPAGTRLMTPEEIAVFVMHYERVTRAILAEMPSRADFVLEIAANQSITALHARDAGGRLN